MVPKILSTEILPDEVYQGSRHWAHHSHLNDSFLLRERWITSPCGELAFIFCHMFGDSHLTRLQLAFVVKRTLPVDILRKFHNNKCIW